LGSSDLWSDIVKRIEIERRESKNEQEAVRGELTNLRLALSSLNVGIILTDQNWSLAWWNQPGGELLKLREPDDVNAYLFALIRSPQLKDYVENKNFREPLILKNQPNTSLELFFGEITSNGHIILVRDVSHIQKLNEMRSDFIANASHELKTPLTVINGYLETLIDNQLVEGVAKKAIVNAAIQGQRMSNIIQDLMTLSQLETSEVPDITTFDLLELLEQAQHQAETLAENLRKHNTTIQVSVVGGWTITGNLNEIFSLVSNLLSNSVRYCPDGTLIDIGIEDNGKIIALYIRDNGPGIPSTHLERLTERFYRIDKSHSSSTGGTGLGLAIAKHIMQRHDGLLQISSVVGTGTCVKCLFPAQKLSRGARIT
jgi:two-component system phosphate regulon sensor histidine kinase PhoR